MIFNRAVNLSKSRTFNMHVEKFESAYDLSQCNANRDITDSRFFNMYDPYSIDSRFCGVSSLDQAVQYLQTGYKPAVDILKETIDKCPMGDRNTPTTDVVGFAPIVPLVLQGVPQNMASYNTIKTRVKVMDVYYDMSCNENVSAKSIAEAGRQLLSTIVSMEKKGYRFNLYGIQGYSDYDGSDVLAIKIKSSGKATNLNKISFPLTHPAFFRVIGWDWYSKCPSARYRNGYGRPLSKSLTDEDCKKVIRKTFGPYAIYVSAQKIVDSNFDTEAIKKQLLDYIR